MAPMANAVVSEIPLATSSVSLAVTFFAAAVAGFLDLDPADVEGRV